MKSVVPAVAAVSTVASTFAVQSVVVPPVSRAVAGVDPPTDRITDRESARSRRIRGLLKSDRQVPRTPSRRGAAGGQRPVKWAPEGSTDGQRTDPRKIAPAWRM